MEEILEILEKNSKYNEAEIASMTGKSLEEVKKAIKKYEEDNVIVGYPALINWEKTSKDSVVALDRKSTRLNSSHANISYAVFCLKKKIYLKLAIANSH